MSNTIYNHKDDEGNPLEVGAYYSLYSPDLLMASEPQAGPLVSYGQDPAGEYRFLELLDAEPFPWTDQYDYAHRQ